MESIHLCTIIPDPAAENDDGQLGSSSNSSGGGGPPIDGGADMAMISDYMWTPGQTIRIKLLGGTSHVRKMVKKYARVWLKYANLKMNFVRNGKADIRVSFVKGGSWSVIGTNCRNVSEDKATMNFGWFTDKTPENEFARTVLHEFGHALGCIHEHQSPAGKIPWDKDAVYKYYKRTMGWDRARVRTNIFQAYSVDTTQFSSFDKKSIMLYAIPSSLTGGRFSTKFNSTISKTDKRFIAEAYPSDDGDSDSNSDSLRSDFGSLSATDSNSFGDSGSDSESATSSDSESEPESEDELVPIETVLKGEWRGYYYYPNGTTDGQSVFRLRTKRASDGGKSVVVDGSGSDWVGPFTIKGDVGASGRVSFIKTYNSSLRWEYSGRLDEKRREMKGDWGRGQGTFRFTRS